MEDHAVKTYHLDLDANGDIIVSEDVLAELQKLGMANLTIENTVPNPPPIGLSTNNKEHDRLRHPQKFKPITKTRGRRAK